MRSRRVKILNISRELFLDLFRRDDGRQLYFEGMPADASLIGISDQVRFDRGDVSLMIQSETFPEVAPMSIFPELVITVREKKPDAPKTRGPEFL